MGEETASLEPTTAPAIHDINETERKLEDLKLLFDGGYTDKDETKFAKEVLEIDAAQITDKEKEAFSKSPTDTPTAWKASALSNKTRTPTYHRKFRPLLHLHLALRRPDARSDRPFTRQRSQRCFFEFHFLKNGRVQARDLSLWEIGRAHV